MNINNLNKIQSIIDSAVDKKFLAGMNVLIFQNDKEIGYFQGGYSDIKNQQKYQRDTICRMYSMTKPVTSIAAMILLEEGKIDLGEEIANYLPEFWNLQVCYDKGKIGNPYKSFKNILVQDLLNMSSGHTYGAWGEESSYGEHQTSKLIDELNADVIGNNSITTREFSKRISKIPVIFEPGTGYNYGFSADILGALIEEVSQMKFSDFLKTRIFEPLKMFDTDFYVPSEKQNRLSKVYKNIQNNGINSLEIFENCNLGIQPYMTKKPSFESGGAGLCSTIDDYMNFTRMLTNKGELNGVRILKEKTVDYLQNACLTPQVQQSFDKKMGHLAGYTYANLMRIAQNAGSCALVTQKGEMGWDGWLGPHLSIDIKNQLAIVLTMQRTDSGTTSVTRKIKNVIYTSL